MKVKKNESRRGRRLSEKYGRVTALDGLSLKVEENSITGLIGPNRAGKTTTIKITLGLLKQNKGWVRVFGRPVGQYGDQV
ncbi:MAG: ATP-binding cassette domain-containing protein [Thermoproteota archaeon]|nr:ATP-binding cassette domain-containing protein [Candidatus Brockarchaeota archaeon]